MSEIHLFAVVLLCRDGKFFECCAFLGDVESERLCWCAGAGVFHVMHFTCHRLEALSCLECHSRLALHFQGDGSVEDIYDLVPCLSMLSAFSARRYLTEHEYSFHSLGT